MHWDDGNYDGIPDFYFRDGKYVFLIEFKDAMMASETIGSYDFQKIKSDIDTKYVRSSTGAPKGVSQLFNQIEKINRNEFHFDQGNDRPKSRNLVIYPIIIYTDNLYSMPGVNRYLNNVLKKQLSSISVNTANNSSVNDLVLIDFQFFFDHLPHFQSKEILLKNILDLYIAMIARNAKKAIRTGRIEDITAMHSSFDEAYPKLVVSSARKRNPNHMKKVFEIFDFDSSGT